ncbi:protein phosphatase 2C domain-containing protein [Edaphobacter flagellatus]|uniref:protein phosphatase 2C domain-containing protein n=1 Tax=Edaphobacter flagellatus TaxID=1933044 RepID=UPI0021B39E7A|nr:protein phosphatase 2C domain-containing protein [Edaphobacter flagellatus]
MRIDRLRWLVCTLFIVLCPLLQAQKTKDKAGYDRAARATVLHEAIVYVAADADSQKVSLVTPGHEVVIVERSTPWVKVFANTDVEDDQEDKPEFGDESAPPPASGWIRDKGVVTPSTPGGDLILYGAAANLEDAASRPNAPKGAAMAAHLLYRRVAEYFPNSSLAPEAAWRSADIRWQLAKADIASLPSAREQDPTLRPRIFDGELKKVIKNYPGTKYAAMAAYELIDAKLCGDWQGLPKCPEMEAGLYEKYAAQFPDSPRAAEALYNATYRTAVTVTMYTVEENRKKSEAAAAKTQALAEQMKSKYPQSDFTARAAAIAYKVQQGVVIYGNDRD